MTESHQSSKADTSGTAKALVHSLGTLAGDVRDPEEVITMIRDRDGQVRLVGERGGEREGGRDESGAGR